MDQTTRNRIRTAGEAALTVKKLGTPEDIHLVYDIYAETQTKAGQKPCKEKYFHELHDKLGEYSVIFGAYEGETLVGMLWLGLSETVAVELYSGVNSRGEELAAHFGLRWEAIRRVKQWGIPTYDIGGVNPQDETDVKQGFGHVFTDYGTFVLPLSPLYSVWARASRNRKTYAS
jgi:lipid II:glycine glycyltransferase (peptidoglycan interpeptide bridge formation enzyme)